MSFYQQYNNVVLTSSLQRRFTNNITKSLGRLLTDVDFPTLVQHHDMVELRCYVKTTAMQRHYDIVCLLGCRELKQKSFKINLLHIYGSLLWV